MILEEFNKNYVYSTDSDNYGRIELWTIIEPNQDGKYIGDCEDYVLTVKKLVDDFIDFDLYYCKLSGVGHCVGITNNKYVIDCNTKELVYIDDYLMMFDIEDNKFTKYKWYEVCTNILIGKLYKFARKLVTRM